VKLLLVINPDILIPEEAVVIVAIPCGYIIFPTTTLALNKLPSLSSFIIILELWIVKVPGTI
jgi:hypothetical protein